MIVARTCLASATTASAITLAGMILAGPCLADAPLAGSVLTTATRGVPICTTQANLQSFLHASILHDYLGGFAPVCAYAPYGVRVTVLEDLPIRNAVMHMILARFDLPFPLASRIGYTYSKGFQPIGYGYDHDSGYLPFTYNHGTGF